MTHAVDAAQMSSAAINDLRDDQFAYIEPGGSKDEEGKTTPRSLRHFPIHDEAHVRNALSRAPQSPFGDKALPKIRAAAKRYGIKISAAAEVTAAEMLGIELARPGKWRLKSGELEVTPRMLDDAARFANREGGRPPPLKIGHTDERFRLADPVMAGDGEPAFGWVHNVRVEEDDDGHVLKADITGDDWLIKAMPTYWPDRSIEGWADYEHDGEKYGLVVEALALLGVTPPGMSSIKSLRDLPAALGVAASGPLEPSGTRIVASFGDALSPAPEAVVPPITKGVRMSSVDKAEIREALGLDPDASDEQVRTAFDAEFAPPEPAPQPVAAAAAVKPGTMHVDASAWNEREERIKRLEAADAKRRVEERDQIIASAVKDGKFAPARKEHWVRLWDADPEGTRTVIDTLAKNVMPVMASGYAGDGDDDTDAEFAHLFPPVGGVSRG